MPACGVGGPSLLWQGKGSREGGRGSTQSERHIVRVSLQRPTVKYKPQRDDTARLLHTPFGFGWFHSLGGGGEESEVG
jgi:hypothetical protein